MSFILPSLCLEINSIKRQTFKTSSKSSCPIALIMIRRYSLLSPSFSAEFILIVRTVKAAKSRWNAGKGENHFASHRSRLVPFGFFEFMFHFLLNLSSFSSALSFYLVKIKLFLEITQYRGQYWKEKHQNLLQIASNFIRGRGRASIKQIA